MQAIICGNTALDFWRRHSDPLNGIESVWEYEPARKGPVRLCAPSVALVDDLADALNLSEPVEMLVTSQDMRRQLPNAVCTLCTGPFPANSFARVRSHMFVTTPEFTFLLLARTLGLVQLLELGYELCGTYRMIDGRPEYGCAPLTSAPKLRLFTQRATGIHGRTAALQACQWLLNNSASPAETALSIAFKLPYRQGGYGLRDFELNHELVLNDNAARILGRNTIRPDIFFIQARYPVEYDGPMFHSGQTQPERDERRRNAYNAMNMSVSIFQPRHLTDFSLFDGMMRAIRANTRQRQNRVPAGYELIKYRLLSEVFRYWNEIRAPGGNPQAQPVDSWDATRGPWGSTNSLWSSDRHAGDSERHAWGTEGNAWDPERDLYVNDWL